jgi:hypothetical protein
MGGRLGDRRQETGDRIGIRVRDNHASIRNTHCEVQDEYQRPTNGSRSNSQVSASAW